MGNTIIEDNWIIVTKGIRGEERKEIITLSSSKIRASGSQLLTIRIGISIIKLLKWKLVDRVDLFYDKNDIHKWMICKTSTGYKFTKEATSDSAYRLTIRWRASDLGENKLRTLRHEIKKDRLFLYHK